jgi:hypothetical protein
MSPFFLSHLKKQKQKGGKKGYHMGTHGHSILYSIRFVVAWSLRSASISCLFFSQFFSLFSKPKNQKQVKDASNSISVTTREERRRRRRCRELCSCCTHTQRKRMKKEENLYKKSCGHVGMSKCSARNEQPPARAAHRRRRKSNVFATSVLSSCGNSMPWQQQHPSFSAPFFCCCIISQFPATYNNVMQLTKYRF